MAAFSLWKTLLCFVGGVFWIQVTTGVVTFIWGMIFLGGFWDAGRLFAHAIAFILLFAVLCVTVVFPDSPLRLWHVAHQVALWTGIGIGSIAYLGGAVLSRTERSLHLVAQEGDVGAVKRRLNKGLDVDLKNEHGWTPLHCAAYWSEHSAHDVAVLLLARGANVNAKTKSGDTALCFAACGGGDKKMATLLLAKGADVNARGASGGTPLHAAAISGNKGMVALLLANGADVNLPRKDGQTPLKVASRRKVRKLLKRHGARENIPVQEVPAPSITVHMENGDSPEGALPRPTKAPEEHTSTRCPGCGFTYKFDGRQCGHCGWPQNDGAGPADASL